MQYSGVQSRSATGILNGLLRFGVCLVHLFLLDDLLADANRRLRETKAIQCNTVEILGPRTMQMPADRLPQQIADSDILLATPGDIEREK